MAAERVLSQVRVLHIIKSLGRGGAEMLLLEGMRAASETTRQTFAYFVPWKDALVGPLEAQGASVTCFPAKNPVQMTLRVGDVARLARSCRADVIHSHLPLAGVVARAAGRLAGIPVVYTEHNLMERYHPATRALSLATWHLQERVIAVSDDVRASAERHAGTAVPVEVVKNGVSLSHFRRDFAAGERVRAELRIASSAPVVGTVAVFRAQKRLDYWLAAAARFLAAQPEAHFLLVGDGPLRNQVERGVQRNDLQGRAHLVGLQDEVRPYLSAMDAYMMSSVFEGLPVAMLEAMAMELPIVATTVGGIPEVVIEGENGYLVPPQRPQELGDALTALFERGRVKDFGEAARRTVAARFSMDQMQRHLENIYARTCADWAARAHR